MTSYVRKLFFIFAEKCHREKMSKGGLLVDTHRHYRKTKVQRGNKQLETAVLKDWNASDKHTTHTLTVFYLTLLCMHPLLHRSENRQNSLSAAL